ncbi:MAG: chromosomal replication initiator protein DnaA [Planctomycetes bacterium]|nr:chromosomal replication initiator protein DnaA [Planctomycetota bacterium]
MSEDRRSYDNAIPVPALGTLWISVLKSLQRLLQPAHFETWFRRSALASIEEPLAVVVVPNAFCASWLERYYMKELQTALREHMTLELVNREPLVRFSIHAEVPSVPFDAVPTTDVEGRPSVFAERSSTSSRHETPFATKSSDGYLRSTDGSINTLYTFEQFVTGRSNELAHAAAQGVVESPGRLYNPFFLYGSVGLGKTHLLQAASHAYLLKYPDARILYLPCETFINHFISALEEGNLNNFRHRYRGADMILIDDIHLLANKERTQEEFFHTFNVLYNAGKQIILSSDSPPVDIPSLQERLVSRFKWGLVAQIEPPDFETRVAILRRKAHYKGFELPLEVAHYIAENITSNIRELEGAVTKAIGVARLNHQQLTPELAREALRDFVTVAPQKRYPMSELINAVCRICNARLQDLQSKKRNKSIVLPRQLAMFLARELTTLSLDEIGSYFGGRDHSTVLYGIDKVRSLESGDVEVAELLRRIRKDLAAGNA